MKVNTCVGSKLLDKKWKERDLMLHKRKLREIKSAVRMSNKPFTVDIANRNAKREADLESK